MLAASILSGAVETAQAAAPDSDIQTSAVDRPQALQQRLLDAAGLERLAAIQPGQPKREMRIWQFKRSDGVNALLRLMHSKQGVDGELLLFWPDRPLDPVLFAAPGRTTHDVARFWLAGRCDRFLRAEGVGHCRARFRRPPDWARLSQRMPDFGPWLELSARLQDSAGPAIDRPAESGWTRLIETGYGPRHRSATNESSAGSTSHCPKHDPECRRKHQRRLAQFEALDDLIRSMVERRLQPVEPGPVHTGRVASAGSRTFQACGTDGVWVLPDPLAELAAQAGFELPRPGASGYRVTLRGRVPPEWMRARIRGKAVAPPQLVVGTLVSVEPAEAADCRTGSNRPRPPPD